MLAVTTGSRRRDRSRGGDSVGVATSLRLINVRRGDPERIYQAQRAGIRQRIVRNWRQSEDTADALLLQWEIEAPTHGLRRGDPRYWDEAAAWIEGRIAKR